MAYQPIWEGEFDLASMDIDGPELRELLESVAERKLMIIDWKSEGPGGGCPMIKLRGTRAQFVSWVKGYYDPSDETIGSGPEGADYEDGPRWTLYVGHFNLTCIA